MRQLTITPSITQRNSQSLNKYLSDINKYDLISADKEAILTQAIRQGDHLAANQLANGNLRFVVSVAKQYQFMGLSLPDLINEGNIGLLKAVKRFDETKGFRFISYAVWWIRQSIIQAIIEKGKMIRVPSNKSNQSNKLNKMHGLLEQEYERSPSIDELALAMNLDPAEVTIIVNGDQSCQSLDVAIHGQEETCMGDLLPDASGKHTDDKVAYHESLLIEIRRCLNSLPKKQKDILGFYFGIDCEEAYSPQEIGLMFNISSERVRQIKDRGIKNLRSKKQLELLLPFLGK